MPTRLHARRPGTTGIERLFAPPPAGDRASPGLFTPRLRRVSLAWVCASLPVVVLVGGLVGSTSGYLVVMALLASGLYTTPALVNAWLAARRAPRPDQLCWWLWLAALVLMYGCGCAMIAGTVVDVRTPTAVNATVVAVVSLLLMAGVVLVVRSRSGRRAVSVDLLDSMMSVVVVVAPAALLWGDDIVRADDAWYAVPAAIASVCMVFGVYWTVLLCVRLRGDRPASRAVGRIGVALTTVGLVNAVGQTVQGIQGFDLPAAPLLGLHALCMSLLLFVPLYVPDTISPGLDRLPLKDQVRGGALPAVLMLVGLPTLLVTTALLAPRHAWAVPYSLGVTGLLLGLASLRQLVAVRETRRLYRQVEQAASTRRDLLAQVMQRADDDRHRVAAQLHEQAVSAYAAFVSLMQTGSLARTGAGASMSGASAIVRDELRDQAESLRQLKLAVQPLEVERPLSPGLGAPIRAYVDGLYGDRRAPEQRVTVDDDVVLDWPTETIVLRIVQEAVRNIWRHSDASTIEIGLRTDGPVLELVVADDGVGFDPDAVLFESGIDAMRSFAQLAQGTLRVDSAPGRGTRVTARLGAVEVPVAAAAGLPGDEAGRPGLRLLQGLAGSVREV